MWLLVGFLVLGWSGLSRGSQVNDLDEINTEKSISPNSVQLSHIEIQEQFIDFRKLKDLKYRQEIPFGDALSSAFDSTVAHHNYPVTMHLPNFLNTLNFHFAAIDWEAPHKIKYSYYLEGLEEDWGTTSPQPNAMYRNLPFGRYTLHVKAMGASQSWSKPLTYTFIIRRPWWRSWLAYWLYAAILCSIAFFLVFLWQERRKEVEEMQQLLAAYKELPFTMDRDRYAENDAGGFLNLVNHTLENHLSDENFGIAELCEILNISRAQLHRKLKKLTGLSTSHYIRSLRLDIAREMLNDSNLNVSEVAFSVGFSSAAYFSKVFKAQYGYAPSEGR
ncbi:MAG: helix-turn-helix domain-containing protein [Saprospiraceae bacterium]|nr:helix-turn-helix domain-containing protein [Saprospiraceae bacterium]